MKCDNHCKYFQILSDNNSFGAILKNVRLFCDYYGEYYKDIEDSIKNDCEHYKNVKKTLTSE